MRKSIRLTLVTLSLAGISIADNFTTTCNGYYLEDDHILHATCTAENNVANQRQLDLNGCLANLDGQLGLVAKGNAFATCVHGCGLCFLEGEKLTCSCRRSDMRSVTFNTLDLDVIVMNQDGKLLCNL
ncbi:hypothetical protein BDV37DRAFT_289721 [Aspergillus pseudonomiae]|uniref:Cyanovirin-N domain-containing protein n=1 Tax=Aspergillus pseudonomiae TaxID=1506151 RepID=A0A5N7CSG0_9EURO|nr:uncharacterized protein BDV37DRAFT_289721 [Aspergillus pseudonomiae]KAE8397084.1 hypothetical protein BDV37DRAFT_289721 [Aspergillus pseudonomiae]